MPRYGTCSTSTFRSAFIAARCRWPSEPTPGDPKEYLPGCARSSARNCGKSWAGKAGLTIHTTGTVATEATGASCRAGSTRCVP
ncbi:hypothetical protein G6F40_017153 [Rhizopus arrhizus]|nr:hypothetical protein G6F40_017153 [Rhizopus arrhizus]